MLVKISMYACLGDTMGKEIGKSLGGYRCISFTRFGVQDIRLTASWDCSTLRHLVQWKPEAGCLFMGKYPTSVSICFHLSSRGRGGMYFVSDLLVLLWCVWFLLWVNCILWNALLACSSIYCYGVGLYLLFYKRGWRPFLLTKIVSKPPLSTMASTDFWKLLML